MGLDVRPVASKRDLTTFIKLPWRLYRNEPNWVPPLVSERRQFLDRARTRSSSTARREYFLAWRDGRAVGRITAQVDRILNEFQDNDWGLFGFFECEDDPEAAAALLDAAEEWLRARGRDRMVGPMDFTINDECGVLVEGYERPPIILTNWTHRYYPALLEGAGMAKAMDTLMWELRHLRAATESTRRSGEWPSEVESQARHHRAADAQEGHRRRDRPLPRGLQRGLGAQLGLRRR